jgi:phospholipase C
LLIIYQENRSFDHYYGTFPGVDGILAPDGQIKPEIVGLQIDENGVPYDTGKNPMNGFDQIPPGLPNEPFHLNAYYPSSALTPDPTHSFNDMRRQAGWTQDGPQLGPFPMNRFVSAGNTGPLVIGYYTEADLPRYWALATEWTLADNFFSAAWGPSQLNYQYLIAGRPIQTSSGRLDQVTGNGRPPQVHRNIGDLMNDAGVTWAWYVGPGDEGTSAYDGGPFRYFENAQDDAYQAEHFRKYSRLLSDLADGTMPAVSFIQTWCYSEHAGTYGCVESVFDSQNFVAGLVEVIQASSVWQDAAILIT